MFFLSGFTSRFVPFIITIHALVCFVSLIIIAAIDSWKFLTFLPHFIYLAIEAMAILGTILLDPKSWFIVVSSLP